MSRAIPVANKAGVLSKVERDRRKAVEADIRGTRPIRTEPPDTLTDEGKTIYAEILDNLPLDQLNETDGYTVEVIADAIAKMRECRREIAEHGLFLDGCDRQGNPTREQSKAVTVYQRYSDILKKYISELGLSPAARSRIASMARPEDQKDKKQISPLLALLADDEEETE